MYSPKKFLPSITMEPDDDPKFENMVTENIEAFHFMQQYVYEVLDFSSQYGSDISISYTACNLRGKPSKFPNYGDFPQTFVLRTYGTWWQKAPSHQPEYMPQNLETVKSDDYIDLMFEYAVYPWQIYIYETYNPGAVVRIWCTKDNGSWYLLWEQSPTLVHPISRAFCPSICTTNFPTNIIRLEFNQRILDYHTELDAVLLVGSIDPIPSIHDNLPVRTLAKKLEALGISAMDSGKCPQPITKSIINYLIEKTKERIAEEANSPISGSFSVLPDETILKIFRYLDLLSLTRCVLVNKRFHELANDPLLYKSVSLKPYWHRVDRGTLKSFSRRCRLMKKCDISWCGDHDKISAYDFCSFISNCGSHLTHLRLNCCKFVNSACLKEISKYCVQLKELALRNCTKATESGFMSLAQLKNLEILDLYRAAIEGPTLVTILRSNTKMKHLSIGACGHIAAMDDVAFALSKYNPDLISIDFWKSYSLSPAGLDALANCRKIQELDIGWCLGVGIPGDCLRHFGQNCLDVRRIILAALRGLTDSDLIPLFENCTKLEQVDLLGLQGITASSCESALKNCKNLRLLDISFCEQISDDCVNVWRREFPRVSIKRSFQADLRDELQPVIE